MISINMITKKNQYFTILCKEPRRCTIEINLLFPVRSTSFGGYFCPSSRAPDCIYIIW